MNNYIGNHSLWLAFIIYLFVRGNVQAYLTFRFIKSDFIISPTHLIGKPNRKNFSVVSVSPDSYLEELVSTARSSKVLFPPPRVQMIPQMCNQIIHLPNRALQIPSTCDSAVWTNIVHKSKLLVCLHKIRISQRSYRKGNARHHHTCGINRLVRCVATVHLPLAYKILAFPFRQSAKIGG